jgi:hypothetical protein
MARKGCAGGCLQAVLGIAAVSAFAFGIHFAGERIDAARFPWGHPETGRPTLTGTWVGPVTMGSGKRMAMLVWSELAPLDRHRKWPGPIIRTRRTSWLEGHAMTCGNPGPVQRFKTWGKPDEESTASRFHLAIVPADSLPADGLAPSGLKGRWRGGDEMQVDVSFYLRKGKSAISGSDDPDTGRDTPVTLKRGSEADFNSLCSSLRGAPGRG